MSSPPPIESTIHFSNGFAFQLLEPLTDFRACHGAEPPESRIVYKARLISPSDNNDDRTYILKIKVQTSSTTTTATSAPASPTPKSTNSTATKHELTALERFRSTSCAHAPHLIAFESFPQGPGSPLPGGYVSYTAMSKVAGKSLFDLGFWSLDEAEREEIRGGFLEALRYDSNSLPPVRTHTLSIDKLTRVLNLPQDHTSTRHRARRQGSAERDVGRGGEEVVS